MKKRYDYNILHSYFRSHITETALNDFHLHKHRLKHIGNSTGENEIFISAVKILCGWSLLLELNDMLGIR